MNSEHPDKQELIIRNTETKDHDVKPQFLSQYCIGYVLRGTKHLYSDDSDPLTVNAGELYYMSIGQHYVHNIPGDNRAFEEFQFFYSPDLIGDTLKELQFRHNIPIETFEYIHHCSSCANTHKQVICKGWKKLSHLMSATNHYIKDTKYESDASSCQRIMSTLLEFILVNRDCCIRGHILSGNDDVKESFQHIVNRHIFVNISIPELAAVCNKSLTSLKNEFKRILNDSPNRWRTKQRLTYARLLLTTSNKSIYDIGVLSTFPNTSHFIKRFKEAYGCTPANFRTAHRERISRHKNGI